MKTHLGHSATRVEGVAKTSGRVDYIHNRAVPGMLHAKAVRSLVAHGKIVSIDVEAARAHPGVHSVITGEDVRQLLPDPYYGPAFHDQPVLALGKVRFIGEMVAVVLASDIRAAEEAAGLIDVVYDELPAVFDEVAAARPDAPVIHDELRPGGTFADLKHLSGRRNTNVALDYRLRRGDVDEALRRLPHVFEHTFTTPAIAHAPLEPVVAIGQVADDGGLVIDSATQNPSIARIEVARLFQLPESKVQIRTAFLGGGFGAKLYPKLEPLVAVCAVLSHRPVRLALSMDESFLTLTRHASTITITSGVDEAGIVRARRVDAWWNGGAYADIGPRVTQKSGLTAAGPYDIDNVSIDSRAVYTNLPPAGAMRGFGVPQVAWAYERHTDLIAAALDVDPVEFRQRNLLRRGSVHHTGTVLRDTANEEVLDELALAMDWRRPVDPGTGSLRRGRGVAIALKAVVTPSTSGAVVRLNADGSASVMCPTVDVGQGSNTVMAQLVSETLGLPDGNVRVLHADTDSTPYDTGTLGSRSTYHVGNAVVAAAQAVKDDLLHAAAALLATPVGDLELQEGDVVARNGSRRASFRDVMVSRVGVQAGSFTRAAEFTPAYTSPDLETGQSDDVTAFWMTGAAGAEVTVDMETGKVTVERLVVVGDAGRALNPELVRTQLTGAAIMQLGMSMSEELQYDEGQPTSPGLGFYKVPGFLDVPPIECVVVEVPQRNGPYGAKGVGETGTFAVSPAIANAVSAATGANITALPMTPERVFDALERHATATRGSRA
jgi:CO/xanthine dehydrogenase Mo-binding subunit